MIEYEAYKMKTKGAGVDHTVFLDFVSIEPDASGNYNAFAKEVEPGPILAGCGLILARCKPIIAQCGPILSRYGQILSRCGPIMWRKLTHTIFLDQF